MCAYLPHCYGSCSGISFIDSTALAVCHNRRTKQHLVFEGLATRGKTSVDWFFGFKLHVGVNDQGDLLACRVTLANTDDRQPVPALAERLFGKLFGDKGYFSAPVTEQLLERGVHLITKLRSNMKNRLMEMVDNGKTS